MMMLTTDRSGEERRGGSIRTRCNDFHLNLFFKAMVSMLLIVALSGSWLYTEAGRVVSR